MLRPLVLISTLLASPAVAQRDAVNAEGRWGPSASDAQFRAELSTEGDLVRLRIFPVAPEGDPDVAILDNPGIARSPTRRSDRAWLAFSGEGELFVNTLTINDGYTYSDRLTLAMVDGRVTVIRAEYFNAYPVDGQPVAEPFECGQDCYSCEADLLAGTSLAGGEAITLTPPAPKALDAAIWTPDSVYDLGFCPAPE
ncbi:hypothetical protein [Tabrizicola sp.]|uniref:hypothetical protein n=1 Tax=Tabrizicola sp. TaxID=2005166 RepID=UPI003F3EDBDB